MVGGGQGWNPLDFYTIVRKLASVEITGKNKTLRFIWLPLLASPSLIFSLFLIPPSPSRQSLAAGRAGDLGPFPLMVGLPCLENPRHPGCLQQPLHIIKKVSTLLRHSRIGALVNLLPRKG